MTSKRKTIISKACLSCEMKFYSLVVSYRRERQACEPEQGTRAQPKRYCLVISGQSQPIMAGQSQ